MKFKKVLEKEMRGRDKRKSRGPGVGGREGFTLRIIVLLKIIIDNIR